MPVLRLQLSQMLTLQQLRSGTFAAFAAVRHGGSKERQNNKEEKLTMRVISKLCGLRLVIAFAAVLLIGGTAFSAITDPQVSSADLLPGRTEVSLTGSAVCDNPTDTGTGTATIYQVHGRLLYIGLGTVEFNCSTGTLSANVVAIDGFKFQPGPATLLIDFFNTGDTTPFAKGAKIRLQ